MKYRDILKKRKSDTFKKIKGIHSVWRQKLHFLNNDIRWMFLCNQWIRSGKKYVMHQVLKKAQRFIRSEYTLAAWTCFRSSLWGTRLFVDLKTKNFGRKQMSYPLVVRGNTSYTRPMLYLRQQMNSQTLPGYFWLKWTKSIVSTSLGNGPIYATIENKYIQLAKLQNIWSDKKEKSEGVSKLEWNI